MSEDYFVHPSSVVDEGVEIGAGTKIWYFNHVQTGSKLGERCILGQNVNIDRNVVIGNGVKIQNNVSVYNGVQVEDDAFLGPSCVFTNVLNPRSHVERKTEFRPTRVGRGATGGANATVVCGHDLGDYCMIGAGAVVTGDVPPPQDVRASALPSEPHTPAPPPAAASARARGIADTPMRRQRVRARPARPAHPRRRTGPEHLK